MARITRKALADQLHETTMAQRGNFMLKDDEFYTAMIVGTRPTQWMLVIENENRSLGVIPASDPSTWHDICVAAQSLRYSATHGQTLRS